MSFAVDQAVGALQPSDLVVTPRPSDDELAAIIVAYEELWPGVGEAARPAPSPRWRYIGRPWVRRPQYGGWR